MTTLPTIALAGAAGLAIGALAAAAIARRALRAALRRARAAERAAAAARRLADLGAMTGGLAHEIKNPLSTLGLNAQLLAEGVAELPVEPEERDRLARRVASLVRETDRLRGILTDFLEYAGELRLDRANADINTAVDELIDFYLPQAERAGVRLRADLAPGALTAYADVPHLKQAILNLMLNATQAMDHANPDAPREIILRTRAGLDDAERPVVRIHIIDTGPGIPEDALERIFQPYFTTKSGGTGLGLPTTLRIAEAHGGAIEVHTEPGKGTDFALVLPAQPGALTPSETAGADARAG